MAEKTYDGLEVLGKVSGLGRKAVDSIFEEVKENHARLDACVGPHEFEPISESEGGRKFAPDQKCQFCKGTVPSVESSWYKKGLEHGMMPKETI